MDRRRARIEPDSLPDAEAAGSHLRLPERVAHYVRDVLRMEPGDALELFDGTGRILECRLQRLSEDDVRVAVLDDRTSERNESGCHLTLYQSLPKRKRWRWVLEKTTELGVDRIVPLETKHAVVEIPADKVDRKLERWRRIAGSAARQCERTVVPKIEPPRTLAEAIEMEGAEREFALHARRSSPALADRLADSADHAEEVGVWLGPEGGFSGPEMEKLRRAGATLAHLGPRILRAETAAVVAATVVQHCLGDLTHPPDSPVITDSAPEDSR